MNQPPPPYDGSTSIDEPHSVFRGSWTVRIFSLIFLPIVLVFFCWMPIGLAFESIDRVGYPLAGFISLLCLGLAFIFLYYSIYSFTSRIELWWPEKIRVVYPFQTKEMLIQDVKGFTIFKYKGMDATITLFNKDPAKQCLKLRLATDRNKELANWVKSNFDDLEEVNVINEKEIIANDITLGNTREEREAFYKKVKTISIFINTIAAVVIALAVIALLADDFRYKDVAILGVLLCPWIVIGVIYILKGIITLEDGSYKSALPSVNIAYLMPCMMLWLYSNNYRILEYHNIMFPFIVISLALCISTIILVKSLKCKSSSMIYIAVACIAYGYGATIFLNSALDNSPDHIVKVTILEKHPKAGKSSDRFILSSWGSYNENLEVGVSTEMYNKHKINDEVNILVHKGKLGISWFELEKS